MMRALKISLRALGIGVGLSLCLPASATIDCQRAQSPGVGTKARAVIAYQDSGFSTSDGELRSIERSLNDGVLSNYRLKLKSQGVALADIDKLRLIICSEKTDRTLTETMDVQILTKLNVTLAIWRESEQGRPGVFYAVIPRLAGAAVQELADQSVVTTEPASLAGELHNKVWVPGIQEDPAMLALLGYGLGSQLLKAKQYFDAKLVLCISKRDLRRSFASLLRPQSPGAPLMTEIDQLLSEANKRIVGEPPADKLLQASIAAACER